LIILGLKDGFESRYYDNKKNSLMNRVKWVKDLEEGPLTYYYESGRIQVVIYCKEEIKNG